MFKECKLSTDIDLSHFDAQEVFNMNYIFSNCNSLENNNLTNFKYEKCY